MHGQAVDQLTARAPALFAASRSNGDSGLAVEALRGDSKHKRSGQFPYQRLIVYMRRSY
jgi:hypothetical protein